MNIISLNIYGCTYFDKLTSYLKNESAGIICMQEVYSYDSSLSSPIYVNPPGLGVDKYSLQDVVNKIGDYYVFFTPNYQVPYKKHLFYFGNAILSKYPFVETGSHFYDIPYRVHLESTTTLKHFKTFTPDTHPRSLQYCSVRVGDGQINILNTHGVWQPNKGKGDTDRTQMMTDTIVKYIKDKGIHVVAGDLNITPDTKSVEKINGVMRNLVKEHGITNTRPKSKGSKHVIDYIFTNNDLEVNNFRVDDVEVSDHLPLVVEVSFSTDR